MSKNSLALSPVPSWITLTFVIAGVTVQGLEANAQKNPDKVFQIKLALEDGDRVATLSHVRQNPHDRGGAVVHVFRFEGERIAELWDVGQPIPEQMVNENGMF